MSQILLVEDDPVLSRGVSVSLGLEGYQVVCARDLRSAFESFGASEPDLVILDLGLPDGDGLQFVSAVKASGSQVPVLILTARTDEDSVVEGLGTGATDYVRKPFGNRELVARIKSALRQPKLVDDELRYGDLLILGLRRKAMLGRRLDGAKELVLNRREFDILQYLVRNAEKVVTRDQLLSALDKTGEMFDRTVDSHVSHLRSKLRKAGAAGIQISSVYGLGYRLEKARVAS